MKCPHLPPTLAPLGALLALAGVLGLVPSAQAQGHGAAGVRALADLSLEDLMRVEVVSANRGTDTLADVAAPVFVITRDDILRTGVRTVPEALRLAPGVDVARLSGARWAVGVRGDAGRFSNKLQVLVDGRSIYSPLFSGVIWEAQRVVLSEVERIEVIRGPAGATWGANAVNGVINIITRRAQDSLGEHLAAEAGSEGWAQVSGTVARRLEGDADGAWRLDAQLDTTRDSTRADGQSAHDHSRVLSLDWRMDRRLDGHTRLIAQAQALRSQVDDTRLQPSVLPPYQIEVPTTQGMDHVHGHVRLMHRLDDRSDLTFSASAVVEEGQEAGFQRILNRMMDLEAEHAWRPRDSAQHVTWGLGTRLYADRNVTLGYGRFTPAERSMTDWHVFLQDRWTGFDERLSVVAGLRIDHTLFAGTRRQPSLAAAWKASADTTWWTSMSRAIRVPSRGEEDADLAVAALPPGVAGPLPVLLYNGSRSPTVVESVRALQAGVRSRWSEQLAFDLAIFRQRYDPLTFTAAAPVNPTMAMAPVPHLQADLSRVPGRAAVSGLEAALDWRPLPAWRQQVVWSRLATRLDPASPGDGSGLLASPRHRVSLRTSYDVSPHLSVDAWLRHTSAREHALPARRVAARTVLDLGGRWAVSRSVVVALRATDLGVGRRVEIHPDMGYSVPVTVSPGVALRVEMSP
ncbi:MAG: hypothetical protein RL456_309 [Pseudomonadota bacterium]|jgi:iron complex outermembrane receptor protein